MWNAYTTLFVPTNFVILKVVVLKFVADNMPIMKNKEFICSFCHLFFTYTYILLLKNLLYC